jgi:glycosyltransferase involved in cell wall biosynthesis
MLEEHELTQTPIQFLVSSPAYNEGIQQKLIALYECSALHAFYSTGVDHYHSKLARKLRRLVARSFPQLDAELTRRRIHTIPDHLIYSNWEWEIWRTIAFRLKLNPLIPDFFWERSEKALDRRVSRIISKKEHLAFLGTDYSCLGVLNCCKSKGIPSFLVYLSPHHSALEEWVNPEYEKFPELKTKAVSKLNEYAKKRDARRDEELALADFVITNSEFTSQSFIRVGVNSSKILTLPHGTSDVISDSDVPEPSDIVKIMYAGPVSVRKGAHYLLNAWKSLEDDLRHAQLDVYGSINLPDELLRLYKNLKKITFHGSIPRSTLKLKYRSSSVLVFPTLLDGFGMVVTEALSQGLPVITTPNAGASDLIEDGKNGFIIPPKDPVALAEKLRWCINNSNTLYEMKFHALETARRHTWVNIRQMFRQKIAEKLGVTFICPDHIMNG